MSFLAVIIFISIITIWVSPHNPTKQNVSYINLPPRIPGLESVNGLNGKTTVAGQLVDKYAQANVPDNVNFYLGTDGLGRDVPSRLFMGTRISLLVRFIAAILRYYDWGNVWTDFRVSRRSCRYSDANVF